MITREEYELLKNYRDIGFNWLARDKNLNLFTYREMPRRSSTIWNVGGAVRIRAERFTFIKWEDEKPTSIADLIRDYESHQVITGGNNLNKAELMKEIEEILDDISVSDYQLGECEEGTMWTISSITIRKILSAIEKHSIEKEKQYILKFSNGQYLYSCDLGITDEALGCKLTKAEIEAVDPRLMQFAEEVE